MSYQNPVRPPENGRNDILRTLQIWLRSAGHKDSAGLLERYASDAGFEAHNRLRIVTAPGHDAELNEEPHHGHLLKAAAKATGGRTVLVHAIDQTQLLFEEVRAGKEPPQEGDDPPQVQVQSAQGPAEAAEPALEPLTCDFVSPQEPEVTRKLIINHEWVARLRLRIPPSQRGVPPVLNKKKREVLRQINLTGRIPGHLIIAVLDGVCWFGDGQQRVDCFERSDREEVVAYVDYRYVKSQEEIGEIFRGAQGFLLSMSPDDILRSHERENLCLQRLMREVPWMEYRKTHQRMRGGSLYSPGIMLKCLFGSMKETPVTSPQQTTEEIINLLTNDLLDWFIPALHIFREAFYHDDYFALRGTTCITLLLWLYRLTVVERQPLSKKATRLTHEQFEKGLYAMTSGNGHCLKWFQGGRQGARSISERSPAYAEIRAAFVTRLEADLGHKVYFPDPPWSKA